MLRDIDISHHSKLWQTSLHFRPQITWLKDGIELNSFSEHEHVSFDLSSFFFSSCSKLFKLWWKQQIPDLWVADTEKWDKGERWKATKPVRHSNWISCLCLTKNKNLLFCSQSWRSTQQCRGMPGKYETLSNENLTSFAHQKILVLCKTLLVFECFGQVLWMPGS